MADPDIATMSVDIMNCDREPVHIAGAILPHGAMLVLDGDTLEVLQAAGDTSRLLVGVPLGELLGQSAATLFSPDQIENLRGLAAALDLVKPRHMLDPQLRVINGQPLDASLHRSAGSLVLEFEAADIPQQACALYVKNWLRLITQVDYDAAPLVPAANPRTGAPPDMSQAILRNVSPIHREYLRNMGIDASMSI